MFPGKSNRSRRSRRQTGSCWSVILPEVLEIRRLLTANPVANEWDTYQGNPAHTGYVPGVYDFTNATLQWQTTVSPSYVEGLAVGGGMVLATNEARFTNGTTMAALNQSTGATVWSKAYDSRNDTTSPPAYANGIAYVQTDGHSSIIGNYLYAYNVNTGAPVFQSQYDAQWETYLNPTPYGSNVYIGGGYYGGMYSFNATSGTQNWFGSVPQYDGWTPAVDGQYAYAYTGSGSTSPVKGVFSVINLATGTTAASIVDPVYNWTGYTMNSAVVLGTHNDAFTINGGRLVSWDTTLDSTHTPHIAWSLTDDYSGQPTLANGDLYVVNHGHLNVLDEVTGQLLWSWTPPSGSLMGPMIATDNEIFVETANTTYAIDLSSHAWYWSYGVSGTMAFSGGTLYVGDRNGAVSAFTEGQAVVLPIVSSPTVTNVTTTAATLGGNVVTDGGSALTVVGVLYSLTSANANPQLGGTGVTNLTSANSTGTFTLNASGLTPGASYSFVAYATNSLGTTYTSPVSTFTTAAVAPTVSTPSFANVTSTSATLGGNVTSDGGAAITERGVVYSLTSANANPTLGGFGVAQVTAAGTTGVFTANVNNLTPGAAYSFAAYAINSLGTTYTSPIATFVTSAVTPTVTTPTSANLTATTATLGGNVTTDGGAAITERGVLYALTSANSTPMLGGSGVVQITAAGTIGVFSVNVSNLTPGATYSFVAYATNSVGTTYTSPVSTFTALAVAPNVTSPTSTNVTATTATLGGNVLTDGGAAITERGVLYALTSANATPMLGGSGVVQITAVGTTGVFNVNVSTLTPGATYSFVAYATNSVGTTYTSPVSTFTAPTVAPTVTTPKSSNITGSAATLGGNVVADGGAAIIERGVLYSLTSANANPTLGTSGVTQVTSVGTTGSFTVNVNDLTQGTAYSFVVYATNSVGTTYTSPVTTFTTLANHAPTGTAATITTLENTPYVFKTLDFGFSDPNDTPPNTLLAVQFSILPNAGTLTDNGVAVTVGQFVTASDISAGKLVFTPNTSLAGMFFLCKFQVEDNGGTANGGMNLDPIAKSLYANILNVNHAPSGTSGTVTTAKNTVYTFKLSDFGFTDVNDAPPNSLVAVKFSLLPNSGTLRDNGMALTVNQFVSASDIIAGKLVFTPQANLLGTYFLCKFQVEDNGGTANGGVNLDPTPKNLYVNIVKVNHAPAGTSGTVTGVENTKYIFKTSDFGFTDSNDTPANALLAVKFTLLPNAGSLTDNGVAVAVNQFVSASDISTGKLVFKPNSNLTGTFFLCKFQVEDNGGTANGGVNLDPVPKVLNIQLKKSK